MERAMSPAWLLLAIPVLVSCVVLGTVLVRGIVRVVRGEYSEPIATVRLLADQQLHIDGEGSIALYAWTRRASADFARVECDLVPTSSEEAVPGSRSWLRENNRTFGWRHRVKLWSFDIPGPGEYRLRVAGFDPKREDEDTELLLANAPSDAVTMGALAPRIPALVLVVFLGIGSLILTVFSASSIVRQPSGEASLTPAGRIEPNEVSDEAKVMDQTLRPDMPQLLAWIESSDTIVRGRRLHGGSDTRYLVVSVWKGIGSETGEILFAELAGASSESGAEEAMEGILFLDSIRRDTAAVRVVLPIDQEETVPFRTSASDAVLSVSALEGIVRNSTKN